LFDHHSSLAKRYPIALQILLHRVAQEENRHIVACMILISLIGIKLYGEAANHRRSASRLPPLLRVCPFAAFAANSGQNCTFLFNDSPGIRLFRQPDSIKGIPGEIGYFSTFTANQMMMGVLNGFKTHLALNGFNLLNQVMLRQRRQRAVDGI
jgi:hypothetical protein